METHIGPATNGTSEAQHMAGPDGEFFVKFPNNPQGLGVLYNDHVVGRIGEVLGVASAAVSVVSVDAFVANGISFRNGVVAAAGEAHGSELIDRVDVVGLSTALTANPANRERYIGLMVLFTICAVSNQQYVYEIDTPNRIYSVDHGFAFGGTPTWSSASLSALPIPTAISQNGAPFTNAEAAAAVPGLNLLTDEVLQDVTECPPEWGVSDSDRASLRDWLKQRIEAVRTILGAAP
jgi:hypothetical protein